MTILRVLKEARRDMLAAAQWYDEQRPGLGEDFEVAVRARFREIAESPHRFPRLESVRTRRFFRRARVKGFPYIVVFEELPDECVVYAVAHTSRRPGYWLRRKP